MRREKSVFRPGAYGAKCRPMSESLNLVNHILISIGANVPIVSVEYARPFRSLPRNAIAQTNRTA